MTRRLTALALVLTLSLTGCCWEAEPEPDDFWGDELPPEEDVLAACETDRHYQRFLTACKERYDRYLKVIELFRSPSASLERAHEEALALSAMPFGGRLS